METPISEEEIESARKHLVKQGILCAWLLDPHQLDIYEKLITSKEKEFLIFCARRWGKSVLTCSFAVEYCLRHPNKIVRIAANSLKQAYEIAEDIMSPLIMPYVGDLIKKTKSDLRWNFENGSSLRLGTIERAHVDSMRGGGSADIVIIEEGAAGANSDEYEYAFKSVIGPQIMRTKGSIFHVTTPSPEPDHFVHRVVMPRCVDMGTFYIRDIRTNTSLDEIQIKKAIELCGGETSDSCQRELFCKIVKSSIRALFPNFLSGAQYTAPDYCFGLISIDWGGVRDFTAALYMIYDYVEKKFVAYSEQFFPPNTPTHVILKDLRAWEQTLPGIIKARWVDAPGQLLVDLRNAGYDCQLPAKYDWEASINSVRVASETGQFIVRDECKFLVATMKNGMYNAQNTDFNRTANLGHCDAVAAAMYAFRLGYTITENPFPEIKENNSYEGYKARNAESDKCLDQLAAALTRRKR